MCIVAANIQFAEKDIPVWKVMEVRGDNLYTIFRSLDGNQLTFPPNREHTKNTILRLSNLSAIGFDQGYGYSCFLAPDAATEFTTALRYPRATSPEYKTIQFIIPVGTKYATGVIAADYVGAGIQAVRTEKIVRKTSPASLK